jgi:hypothetical protein
VARECLDNADDKIDFISGFILEQIGIPVETTKPSAIDSLLEKFGAKFPTTREFSAYARSTSSAVDSYENPDAALMQWMEQEELLFRTLEKHIITERLNTGFANDVDVFLSFSLSVQNRRKSRVGFALENHFETILHEHGIRYSRGALSEARSRPDFLFPGSREYFDGTFPSQRLTMLAVKTTCKDRWRQILAEAAKIPNKHLLTLETAISIHQTSEMTEKKVQLVLPEALHKTFLQSQRNSLMSVTDFLDLIRDRQQSN